MRLSWRWRLIYQRGENDLAIRLHQKMLEDADLPVLLKPRVRLELALDFVRSGLVDRAEEQLLQLLDGPLAADARQNLLDIYQQERDWPRAIEMARTLRTESVSYQHEMAQFYCELTRNRPCLNPVTTKRGAFLDEARLANRRSARISLIAGDIALAQGQHVGGGECVVRN